MKAPDDPALDSFHEIACAMAQAQACALESAIGALLRMGVSLDELEIAHYPHGLGDDTSPYTVVRRRSR